MIMFLTNWIFLSHLFRIAKKITRNSIVGWRCSKPKWKGPESSDDAITQAYGCSHENFENEIEDFSEEDVNQLDSESFNDSFDAGVIADNVGPAID